MTRVEPLIRTKLRAPLIRSVLVARPRLNERIIRGLVGPLTLVIAPAGFGKTTLVASSVANCGMPVAWLALDQADNRAGRFLNYLFAALQGINPAIGNDAAHLLMATEPVSPEAVLTSLVNDLDTANHEIILVLDDYQFIHTQAVHEQVAFLLDHCPDTLHIVIASRSDPALPLARFRARGRVVELRAADLVLTQPEAARFLNDVMGLHLDAESIAVLEARTEGWVAGLQMAALSMRDREDIPAFIQAFSGTNRYILDYMLEEVLAREPEEVQAFLLQTCILTRLTGPLVDAVTGIGGGQVMLEHLEKRNLFLLPLDDERRWYRYHHLFSDLLQARLYHSHPELVLSLFSRAANWCEQQGLIAEAVSYAVTGKDYAQAAVLVSRYWGQAISGGEIETVWSWLDALPAETVRNSAMLGVAYCWLLWLKGQIGVIEAHLVDAERAWNELVSTGEFDQQDPEYAVLPAQLIAMRAFIARYRGDIENAPALAERAISLVPAKLPPEADAPLRSIFFVALASAYEGAGNYERAADAYAETIRLSRLAGSATGVSITFLFVGLLQLLGRLRAADAACREALEYVHARGMARAPAAGILHIALSEVLVECNDLAAAEAHLAQGFELGKWSGRLDAVRNAPRVLARTRQIRHDASGALATIQEAESAQVESIAPSARADLLALRAEILLRQGAVAEAAQCVDEAVRLIGSDRGQTRERVDLAASRLLLAQRSPDDAITQLTQSVASAEMSGRLGVAIELRILRSFAFTHKGDTQGAEADLTRALALAEPEGYVRIFVDEGQPMQKLLANWLAHNRSSSLRNYAARLLSQFDAEPLATVSVQEKNSSTGTLVEPLSPRELEVLEFIAMGKTNREIARQLIVSPGTVKAHTASIYRKLDVANRTAAVARARELGILS